MASVYDVAEFFVSLANQEMEGEITSLKLNILLFFAQGHYLAKTGKLLFNNLIEAWIYGPVVPPIYEKYKEFKDRPIKTEVKDTADLFTDEESDVLFAVAREYGKYTAAHLVNETHKLGSPWSQTKRNAVIDNKKISEYFSKHEKIETFDEALAKMDFIPIGRHDSKGNLILPTDEYDETDDEWKAQIQSIMLNG